MLFSKESKLMMFFMEFLNQEGGKERLNAVSFLLFYPCSLLVFLFFNTPSFSISLLSLISSIPFPATAFHSGSLIFLFFSSPFFFFHYNNCLKFKLVEIFQDMHHICLQIKTRGRSFYTCSCSHLHISG